MRDGEQPLPRLGLQLLVVAAGVGEHDGGRGPSQSTHSLSGDDLRELRVVGASLLVVLRKLTTAAERMRAAART